MRRAAPPRAPRWRRVGSLGALLAAAALAAFLIGYRPSINPLGAQPRGFQLAAARAQVLIDTPTSGIGATSTTSRYQSELGAQLALSYALYMQTDAVTATIGRDIGLGGRSIAASGPFTLQLNRIDFFPPETPSVPEPRNVDHSYRLLLDVDGRQPILSLYSQAPTVRGALAIVNDARTLLERQVAAGLAANPPARASAVALRALGPAVGTLAVPQARWQLMALGFAAVLAVGGSLMWAWRRRRVRAYANRVATGKLDRLDEPDGSDDWPHTRRVLPWSIAAFIAMLFLVPIDAIELPVHLPINSHLDRPFLIAIAMLWFASLAVLSGAARPRVKFTGVHFAVFAFLAVSLFSIAVNGPLLANMDDVTEAIKKLALLVSYISFFVIAASVIRPREVPRFVVMLLALGVIVAIATMIEYRTHYDLFYGLWGKILHVTPPPELDRVDYQGRFAAYGPTVQPLELAAMLSMLVPFAVIGMIDAPTRRQRILYTIAFGLLLAGGLATGRKTSVVVPTFALLLLIAYRPRALLRKFGQLSILIIVLVHFAAPQAIGELVSELEPGHVSTAPTTTARVARYDAVTPDVLRHPVIGRGYGTYDTVKNRVLDNQYLDLLITVGAVGTLCYLAMFGAMILAAHRTIRGPDPKRASLALAAAATVLSVAIASALFDVLYFPHLPYLLFFVAAMILAMREPSPAFEPARLIAQRPVGRAGPYARGGDPEPAPALPPPAPREPILA